jgi:hypothetical protein
LQQNQNKQTNKHKKHKTKEKNTIPVSIQTFPKSDQAVSADGHDPGVYGTLGLRAKTHVGIQAEA